MKDMRVKNSVGIWAFQLMPTRFLAAGYHPQFGAMDMVERTKHVVDRLGDLVDGYEYHYPGEINEDNAGDILRSLGKHDVYCIASGLHTDSANARGAFCSPDARTRQRAIEVTLRGIDLAAKLGANFIIWPGIEGYNYPFQVDYQEVWSYFIDGVQAAVEHATSKGVTIFLEHKNSEPAMRILMRDMGMTMFVIHKLAQRGTPVSNVKINMDWQHLIMNGENPAEYVELLAGEGLLGHQHANSGWGTTDDDNMVGAAFFMGTLEIARALQKVGYGRKRERVGFDLFPYTEDPVEATRQSILQWEFIWELACKLDGAALAEAQKHHDAVAAYKVVYETLGLDRGFADRILADRRRSG